MVGASSANFHSSTGRYRALARKLDYWSIAAASNILTRAVFPNQVPMPVTALGMLLTPFKPFVVASVNAAAMEVRFAQKAKHSHKVRRAQQLHVACGALGMTAFCLEDAWPELPMVHAAWHCLSSGAVATIGTLLADIEEGGGKVVPAASAERH